MNELRVKQKDELRVLLPAKTIPHGALVTKRTGDKEYTLAHRVRVFREGESTLHTIEGRFLISGTDLNQVLDDDLLLWKVRASELYDRLQHYWYDGGEDDDA